MVVWCAITLVLACVASVGANFEGATPVTTARDVCTAPEASGTDRIQNPHQPCAKQTESKGNTLAKETPRPGVTIFEQSESDDEFSGGAANIALIPRPDSLDKVQLLIADVVKPTLADAGEVFIPTSDDPRWKKPPQSDIRGEEVFAQYGLQQVSTPATGNCQYYAVAMALLDMDSDTPQHVGALEQVTQHLKEGILEASRHGYEVEFPHDIRQTILAVNRLEAGYQELTETLPEEESNLLFQEYLLDIAKSASTIEAFVPLEVWGTELTLRMMAKLLQQPIFVVIAPYGLQAVPSYQVYEPERSLKDGHQLDSAEEYHFPSSRLRGWLSRLQKACYDTNSTGNPPIVLLYSHLHYSRVRFSPIPAGPARSKL
ncbi:unnamed protein product [Phytophthora fragariaefolia]|uniref:Unnamed protein product n=1 Tax=Phytophthora fragariaefolia TaxID=1490495 RepID=A0A9W6TMN3_9STRA|nr:unnamed protein product [Phytophthora fragariaefolia]